MTECDHEWSTVEVIGSVHNPGVIEECERCGRTRERFKGSLAPRDMPPKPSENPQEDARDD